MSSFSKRLYVRIAMICESHWFCLLTGANSRKCQRRRIWSPKRTKGTPPRRPPRPRRPPSQARKGSNLQQEKSRRRVKWRKRKAKQKKQPLSAPLRRRSNNCVNHPKLERPKRKNNETIQDIQCEIYAQLIQSCDVQDIISLKAQQLNCFKSESPCLCDYPSDSIGSC